MANNIFRGRLDGDVHAVVEGAEIKRGGPGIVDGDGDAKASRSFADRGDVLNLEGLGPGQLGKDEFRFRPQQARDPVADQGIVILDVDAEPFENAVCEASRRHVNAVADEDVAACFGET